MYTKKQIQKSAFSKAPLKVLKLIAKMEKKVAKPKKRNLEKKKTHCTCAILGKIGNTNKGNSICIFAS